MREYEKKKYHKRETKENTWGACGVASYRRRASIWTSRCLREPARRAVAGKRQCTWLATRKRSTSSYDSSRPSRHSHVSEMTAAWSVCRAEACIKDNRYSSQKCLVPSSGCRMLRRREAAAAEGPGPVASNVLGSTRPPAARPCSTSLAMMGLVLSLATVGQLRSCRTC